MSRYISLARKVFKPNSAVFRASGPVRNVKFAVPLGFKSFATDSHAHASGKDEPFLDVKQVTDRILEVIKNFEKVNSSKITVSARFKEDLDLDSLDAVEIVMAIEEEFNIEIPDSEADKILSIPDAVTYISGHPMAK